MCIHTCIDMCVDIKNEAAAVARGTFFFSNFSFVSFANLRCIFASRFLIFLALLPAR